MDQQDKIAHLSELALEHFNEGNLSGAVSAWQQVLELDAGHAEARRGVQLARQKMAEGDAGAGEDPLGAGPFDEDAAPAASPAGSAGGPFDADATMMFRPGVTVPPRPAAVPAEDQDEEAGQETMMFNPSALPAPSGAGDADDADATMMFNPGALPAAPSEPAKVLDGDEDDADATMMFNPSSMPAPGAPEPSGGDFDFGLPSAAPEEAGADRTVMSPEDSDVDFGAGAPDFGPPPPPPIAPSKPDDDGGLEDFEMPSGSLEIGGPPAAGFGAGSLPEAGSGRGDSGGGFSFDLPPAGPSSPAPSSGGSSGSSGDFNLPELPSLGPPPPSSGPEMPPPPPPPSMPGFEPPPPSGQFGEVDPGEIEGLAVPTIGAPAAEEQEEEAELTDEERRLREERKAAEYQAMYGKSSSPGAAAAGGPITMAPPASTVPWKLLIPLGLVILLGVGAVAGFIYLNREPSVEVVQGGDPEPPPPKLQKSREEWRAEFESELSGLRAALRAGNLDQAVGHAAKCREIAPEAGIEQTPELDQLMETLQFEQGWEAKMDRAVESFCAEQYEDAAFALEELRRTKPGDPRPNEYIARIYYNLGIQELQSLKPWDAVWPFEKALERVPGDEEILRHKAFAEGFPRGLNLVGNYNYTSLVDPLTFRKAGCN